MLKAKAAAFLASAFLLPAADPPSVQFTSVPSFGSTSGVIQGRVSNVDPSAYKAAVFIYLDGIGFYSKPTCTNDRHDLTAIQPDGTFSAAIVTGGVDSQATQVRVYIVPAGFTQPCVLGEGGIPNSTGQASVAHAIVDRPNIDQKVLLFANRRWLVKSSTVPVGPGPNLFGEENAFVDEQGRLHLKIHFNGTNWTCAEVYLEESLGYGTYQFTIDSAVDALPANVVLGLFTWSNEPAQSHREIDIEFGFNQAGDPTNAQYVIQPYTTAGNLHRFQVPASAAPTQHRFLWQPDRVDFASGNRLGNIAQWTASQGIPTPGDELVHLNAWLQDGKPVSTGHDVEIVLSGFTFTPQNSATAPPRITRITNGASFAARVAPGGLFSLFGSGFSDRASTAGSVPLPVTLGDAQVNINGTPVPLFFVSPTQINGQIPYEVLPGTATVSVRSSEIVSDSLAFQVEAAAPGTFVFGENRCLAANASGFIGPGNPAESNTYATFYMSGQGLPDHAVPTGSAAPLSPLSRPLVPAVAHIGGEEATLSYFGLAPALVGVTQANVLIPSLPLADHEFIVAMGQLTSNPCVLRAGDASLHPPPQVLSVVPPSGPPSGGTSVLIYGRDFADSATVQFGSAQPVPVTFISAASVRATTPASTPGSVDVTLRNPDGQAGTLRSGFTFSAPPAPGLVRIDPASGTAKGGTRVRLFGSNFQSGIMVRFGGQLATGVSFITTSEVQATTPASAAGAADVQVTNPDGQSGILRAAFTYVQPAAPHLVSINPASGPSSGGTPVQLSGTNFVSGMQVRFGANPATGVSVSGGTSAVAITPSGSGTVDVQVTNPDGQSDTSKSAFTYTSAGPILFGARIAGCRVSGQLSNVSNPSANRIVVYAQTNQYYLQPCVTEPLQSIQNDGSWGPVDLHNGTVWIMLVKSTYTPPAGTGALPAVDGTNVLAISGAIGTVSGCDVARCPAR